MHFGNKNRGTVSFVFYFIVALALLAVAGYYIGINEQQKLFKIISDKKQQQQNNIENGSSTVQDIGAPNLSIDQDRSIKSIIDSPYVVLRNLRVGANHSLNGSSSSNVVAGFNVTTGSNVGANSVDFLTILNNAKKTKYDIWISDSKSIEVDLVNGIATGNNCYTDPNGKVCFPVYKLEKVWAIGDLNKDGVSDAIVSVSMDENVLQNKPTVSRLFALMSNTPAAKSTSTASGAMQDVSYTAVSLNYKTDAIVFSADISEGDIILIESFYLKGDAVGSPPSNKVLRHRIVEGNGVYTVGEATLFAEQKESTSIWYPYNYEVDNLSFSFKAPNSWQREEGFDKGVKIIFKEKSGRNIVLETRNIVETCSEYNLNLSDSKDVKIKNSEFIDLGQFGVGLYVKYAISIGDSDLKQYHADICVTDKNTDKKVFSLYSTTKEDDIPYFSIFDKIWSTFKIVQE